MVDAIKDQDKLWKTLKKLLEMNCEHGHTLTPSRDA